VTLMRKTLVLCALALVLAGCGGQEAGPTPKGGGQATTPDALATKLRALTADQCFASPARQVPKGCQKYVTELASTAGMVRELAKLPVQADALSKEITTYRDTRCETIDTPGGPCSQTLSDIANTLRDIKTTVDAKVTTR
jgi:hypothetical protein